MRPVKYSVLLLRPDYVADDYGQDTYMAHVWGTSVDQAIERAQKEAAEADKDEDDCWVDYYPLLVTRGHIDDLAPHD